MPGTRKERLIAFGQRLYELRRRRGLSQMQLADLLDMDRRQISRYENGTVEMGALLYEQILQILAPEETDVRTRQILHEWKTLTPENRDQLIGLAKMMNRAQNA